MSSDSDDGLFSNIIKKRDKILSNFEGKTNETKDDSLLDDCIFVDEKYNVKNDDSILDVSLNDRRTKRRGAEKEKPSKRGRKTRLKQNSNSASNNDDSIIEIMSDLVNVGNKRGGKRARGRGTGRGKRTSIGSGNKDTSLDWYFNSKSPSRDEIVSRRIEQIVNGFPPLSNGSNNQNDSDCSIIEINDEPDTSRSSRSRNRGKKTPRGKGRGRPRKSRTLRNQNRYELVQQLMSSIPTFSVGNTEEYDDELEDVPLFSLKQQKNEKVSLNNTETEDNEELSVKVYWQSIEVFKFNIRKYQKLKEIFEFFSKKENIPMERLLFTYNDRIIKQDDTPDSIDYSIAKFIDGGCTIGAVNSLISNVDSKIKTSGVKIKFQIQKPYKPFETFVEDNEKLSLAMTKCAEHLELPIKRLKFVFDGDVITGSETLKDLDMEGDECIDVKIID